MVTPSQILALGEELAGRRGEVHWRTAISRAYYAAFLHLRDRLAELGPYEPRRRGSDHSDLAAAVRGWNDEAATLLNVLRIRRNRADYDIDLSIARSDVLQCIEIARRLLAR